MTDMLDDNNGHEGLLELKMGYGNVAVGPGHIGNRVALFFEPLDYSGPIGDALNPPLPKDSVLSGSLAMSFANTDTIDVLIEELQKARAMVEKEISHD